MLSLGGRVNHCIQVVTGKTKRYPTARMHPKRRTEVCFSRMVVRWVSV